MIDSRKPRMPILPWTRWERGASLLRGGRFKTRDPEPNPVDFKIVEDWTEEFSDEPLINLRHRFCPCAEANGSWSSDPSDWEVPMVAPKALPYLEEVNKGCWLKKNAHDGDWARRNGILNLQLRAERERTWGGAYGSPGTEGAFYKGVPRGFKGAIQENMRFFKVLHGGNGNLRRKVKMNLVNKEY